MHSVVKQTDNISNAVKWRESKCLKKITKEGENTFYVRLAIKFECDFCPSIFQKRTQFVHFQSPEPRLITKKQQKKTNNNNWEFFSWLFFIPLYFLLSLSFCFQFPSLKYKLNANYFISFSIKYNYNL